MSDQVAADREMALAIQAHYDAGGSDADMERPLKYLRTDRVSRPAAPAYEQKRVRLLHLSDTHGMHRRIEKRYPLPEADILVHTGDLTNNGKESELKDVDKWFGEIKHRFEHIVIIAGNHDLYSGKQPRKIIKNAIVLDHAIADDISAKYGLKIFGSPWVPHMRAGNSGGKGHRFHEIPADIHVLLTHGPPRDIFDSTSSSSSWGSSKELNEAIRRSKPRAHLFGHLHEQRGVWQRSSPGKYIGGVEFKDYKGRTFPTKGPPPHDWPCDIVSCNAMTGHPKKDGKKAHIAGPGRLILAERANTSEPWRFTIQKFA